MWLRQTMVRMYKKTCFGFYIISPWSSPRPPLWSSGLSQSAAAQATGPCPIPSWSLLSLAVPCPLAKDLVFCCFGGVGSGGKIICLYNILIKWLFKKEKPINLYIISIVSKYRVKLITFNLFRGRFTFKIHHLGIRVRAISYVYIIFGSNGFFKKRNP